MRCIEMLHRRSKTPFPAAIATLFAVSAVPAFAEPGIPLSDAQILAALDSQPNGPAMSSAARNATGDFVIAYRSLDDGSSYAQLFDADGTPRGARIKLSSASTLYAVSMDDDGDFVVAWDEAASHSNERIRAQRYSHDGSPAGSTVEVAEIPRSVGSVGFHHGAQFIKVAMDADGDFAVTWKRWGRLLIPLSLQNPYMYLSSEAAATYLRIFGADATPRTAAIRVQQDGPTYHGWPDNERIDTSLAMDSDGNVTIAWTPYYGNGVLAPKASSVKAKRFDVNGRQQGNILNVATTREQFLINPVVSTDAAGNFAIAWIETPDPNGTVAAKNDIVIQRYSANGSAAGSPLKIQQQDNTRVASLSMDLTGDFAVTWSTYNYDTQQGGTHGQYYSASGTVLGSAFEVAPQNTSLSGSIQGFLDGSGGLLALWTGYGPAPSAPFTPHIYARLFSGPN